MDFKSLLDKIESIDGKIETPAAPIVAKAVQLNEDAQLRVLSGRTTYVAEVSKQAETVKEAAEKTETTWTDSKGNKHPATKVKGEKYTGKEAEKEEKSDKKAKKESIDAEAFKGKFSKMVEAKKSGNKKPDADGDGVPDWADKKPGEDDNAGKKKGAAPKKGVNPFAKKDESVKESDDMKVGDKKKSSTGGTIEKTKTGVKHTAGKNYSGKAAEKDEKTDEGIIGGVAKLLGKGLGGIAKTAGAVAGVKGGVKKAFGKGKKASTDTISGDDEKNESVKSSKSIVAESVEQKLSFREMMKLVVESGGQQQIDPVDTELFNWAQRVAASKFEESTKAEIFAGMLYERNGGVFEMYDVLSEDQK